MPTWPDPSDAEVADFAHAEFADGGSEELRQHGAQRQIGLASVQVWWIARVNFTGLRTGDGVRGSHPQWGYQLSLVQSWTGPSSRMISMVLPL